MRARAALVVGMGLVGLVLSQACGTGQRPGGLVGKSAPDIVIRTESGQTLGLADLRGRPVVLNFWASWCAACQREEPVLNDLADQGRVSFIGVTIQDSPAGLQAFEAAHPHAYPVGPAVQGSYLRFGVSGPPETFLINSRGTVVAHLVGPATARVLAGSLRSLT